MNNLIILSTQAVTDGRVFGLDQQTLIQIGIQLFNGIILAIALTYILYNPVKEFMQKRSERIENEIIEAEKKLAEANELIEEYNVKLEGIEQERIEMIEKAQAKIREERDEILTQAREEGEEEKNRALDRISSDRERMMKDLRLQAVDMATLMAEKYISDHMTTEAQNHYFDRMLAEMEEAEWKN